MTLGHEDETESWEIQERNDRAKSRAEKRRTVDQLKIAERTDDEIENENAAIRSRIRESLREL